jgi:predicted nucleic acid-binding protein
MQNTIIDSGPLIALFDSNDKYHKQVLAFMQSFQGELITTWAVVTEVSHMLDFNLNVQIDFLRWIELGGISIYDLNKKDLTKIIKMMSKYTNVPMDLADSSLMLVAQNHNIKNIISIDSDFDIYRTLKKQSLNNLLRC